jgi:hypothetical protein
MKKYKCTVETTNEYIITIDDETLGDEFREGFEKSISSDIHEWEEHAEYIAERLAAGDTFIEGYGVPTENGKRQCFTDAFSMEPAIDFTTKRPLVYIDVEELE